MNPKILMFVAFVFFIGSLCCLFIEGDFIGTDQISLANSLTGYDVVEISGGGVWSFAKIGTALLSAIPKMIMWDYNFFTGGYFVFRLLFIMVLSTGVVWGIIQIFVTVAQGIIGLIRGLV
jgi:hypothetical protein